jgi:hypothetical protein
MCFEASVTLAAVIFWLDKWLKGGGSTQVPVMGGGGILKYNTQCRTRRDDIVGSYGRENLAVLELSLSCLTLLATRTAYLVLVFFFSYSDTYV